MNSATLASFWEGYEALPEEIRRAARKAYRLAQGPAELAALAAAHAELGQFDKAVEWQTKALDSAAAEEKEQYRDRLKQYQDRKPYRLE